MVTTASSAVVLMVIEFLIGAVIGLVVVVLVYRARLGIGLAVRGSLFAGVAFLIASGTVGWADSHSSYQNGRRADVAPWGEDLRMRNWIADNRLLLCIASSVAAGFLAGIRIGTGRNEQKDT
jgi:hypothetical protein